MAERHGAADLELLPSGPPRWEPRLGKAWTRLVRRGWLVAGSARGSWELTERGWAKARREEQQNRRVPAADRRVSEHRPAAVALIPVESQRASRRPAWWRRA
jgi:hypothetical protein